MSTLTLILYAAAALLYGAHFIRRDARAGKAATMTLVAAALAHAFVLGMHTVQVGHVPLVGGGEAVSAFVWMLTLTYLYVEFSTNERAMGVFIALPVALLYIVPLTSPDPIERPALLDSPFFAVHTISALCAYASFALACVVSVTYVLLFRELKRKQPGVFFARLPPLRSLDVMNVRAVSVGLIFLSVSVVVGMIWVGQARIDAPHDPRVQAMSIADPKIFLACVSWLLYAFQLYARRVIGWGGQRAAWLSTIGFGSVLANLLAVTYLLHTSHSFN
jgi:ABC-type uncharacterized transport system permease subunit